MPGKPPPGVGTLPKATTEAVGIEDWLPHVRTEWLPVRCCCQPTKILGFMEVPIGMTTSTNAKDQFGKVHTIQIKPLQQTFFNGEMAMHQHRALYSEDRPIEFWRTIPSFIEIR